MASVWPASAACWYQVRAASRSGGSSRSASRCPRLFMASVLPASAAFWYQLRASSRSGGSSRSASRMPRLTMASVWPASAAFSYQVRASSSSADPVGRQQEPEVEHGVGVAGVGGLLVPGAGRVQARADPARGSRMPRLIMAPVWPASAASWYQVRASSSSGGSSRSRAGCRGCSWRRDLRLMKQLRSGEP